MDRLTKDVSGAVQVGDLFELKVEAFLMTQGEAHWEKLVLGIPNEYPLKAGLYSTPKSVHEYRQEKERWPRIVQVLPIGARIEVSRVQKYGAVGWGYSYRYFGTIELEGQRASEVVIDDALDTVHREEDDMFVGVAGSRFLTKINEIEP